MFEILCDFDKDTYRTVYAVRLEKGVYVLDCFQKKSTRGNATPKRIIERIRSRYAMAVQQDRIRSEE